jgi:hypothetical protein
VPSWPDIGKFDQVLGFLAGQLTPLWFPPDVPKSFPSRASCAAAPQRWPYTFRVMLGFA